MKSARVYIVHGYCANADAHWFPWLKDTLTAENIPATILSMPDSSSPQADAWIRQLSCGIAHPDENTYLVGHSLGCITILRYLQDLPATTRIGGLLLVSGFDQTLPDLEMLDGFTRTSIQHQKIVAMTRHRTIIASMNDSVVPYPYSAQLADQLQARLDSVEMGGHFLAKEGFLELPQAYRLLKAMMPADSEIQ